MKKVLLLTHEYYPFAGGVARYLYNLFNFLPADKYLVVTDHPQVPSGANVLNIRLKTPYLRPTWLGALWRIIRIIKAAKVEIILTPNILPLGSLAYVLYKLLGIPYIISLHGLDIRLALRHKKSWTKRILTNAMMVLVNSRDTQGVIASLNLDDRKIHLFYPSINWQTEYQADRLETIKHQLGIQASDKVLLTVGRLNQRKGQDLVIKALRNLRGSLDIKYLIVGRGHTKSELEKLIKVYNLGSRVFILDNIDDKDLVYYFKLANIFVMPNRFTDTDVEGFGIVFLEAAAMGLPIIAGNSGGVTEIFKNNEQAILIDNENIAQLTEAITMLLNNPAKADKLAKAAGERYRDFPTASQQSEKLMKLLS